MLKKTLIGVVLATIAVSGDASAQGITQQTATIKRTPLLQENCGKLAAETFRREPADENRVDYRAHYNIRLNKCFYEETYISLTPVGANMWVYLSDLQDNRIYGGFHMSTNIGLFYCNLLDRECHSEAEWNGLVKPYMEDAITTGTILRTWEVLRQFGQTMKAEPQVEPRRESPVRKKSIRRMGLYFSVLPFAS
jgi:hypothetical protein